ncbi:hypothetical protein [Microbacterium sp. BR1]|uniref:hypothetical protein n=2 Tax=Microbacterium TaxID=33882 RepID=UPI000C2C8AD3|nr:hypothetical protein [Microbacterium sp. BR1]
MTTDGFHRFAGLVGTYIQRHGDEVSEQEAQQKLGGLLEVWRRSMHDRDGVMSREDGSDLRGDELRLPKLPATERSVATKNDPLLHVTPAQQADHAILTFHNLMRGFDSMVVNDNRDELRLHLSAEFVMIRALYETAAAALWVLGPDSSDERITHSLRLRFGELTHSRKLTIKYAELADDDTGLQAQEDFVAGQLEDLTQMASQAGLDARTVRKAITPGNLVIEAGQYVDELSPALTYWYWSTASSIAHAEPSTINLLADMQFIGVDVRDQPIAHVEPSAVAIWNHLDVAHKMISQAHELWNRRAAPPSNAPA